MQGDLRALRLTPGSGRSPGGGNGNPLRILAWRFPWPEEPGGLHPWGRTESDTMEAASHRTVDAATPIAQGRFADHWRKWKSSYGLREAYFFYFPPFYVTSQSSISSADWWNCSFISNERRKKDTEWSSNHPIWVFFVRGASELLDEDNIIIMGPDKVEICQWLLTTLVFPAIIIRVN